MLGGGPRVIKEGPTLLAQAFEIIREGFGVCWFWRIKTTLTA